MDRSRIAFGYDVIDNAHFARGADQARGELLGAESANLPAHYLLCSARFIEKKNLVRLIEAYARFRTLAGPRAWELVLLGDGPLMKRLVARTRELGVQEFVHFAGFRQYEELPMFYGRAIAFVLPSTTEQWGLVTNEAMAAGLPVLVSEACGSAELVEEGTNGFLFDPLSVDDIARGMMEIWRRRDSLPRMAAESRRLIARLSPSAFAEGLVEAMEKGERFLVSRRPRWVGFGGNP
jgi:glycosyltransferase involved in cell wall biosynthesis